MKRTNSVSTNEADKKGSIGILGGSFNPVHLGHIFLAEKVLVTLKLERVIFVPAYQSPFKLGEGKECSSNDRLEMLSAAIAGDSRFAIDDCEIKRGGVSYTVDTIEDIIERYMPEGKPVLIIGDDLATDFYKWHEYNRILQLADIVIARRINPPMIECNYPHTYLDNEVMNISSSVVREKINTESDWRSLVPLGVKAIIEDKCLYNYSGQKVIQRGSLETKSEGCTQAVIQRLETAARETLGMERFLHSRNTALLASDMCRRFGLDPAAGYLAGITHDLAKQTENKQLIKIVKNAGIVISALEKEKPNLLHGKAAAVILKERYGITNKDVLEAVACHTSGNQSMGPLAKIIYIADKTESSRNIDPLLREMCLKEKEDLDSILYSVLEKTIGKLQAKKLDLSEDTLLLLNKIKERSN
ncbi:MAG: nicotinate (nicotinamide) nucleotide adenylyltransferase [Treponema sp.]|nr:nicotinate (nicotinamide) nucleotide adenylyltransferase [Treponema sp.]MCL2251839.1 nicotinate (nicotinamide) nucleotide adenylyltransferase [Treponema sp.]